MIAGSRRSTLSRSCRRPSPHWQLRPAPNFSNDYEYLLQSAFGERRYCGRDVSAFVRGICTSRCGSNPAVPSMLELRCFESEAIYSATLFGRTRHGVIPESLPLPGLPGAILWSSLWPSVRRTCDQWIGVVGHIRNQKLHHR
jgi:hypothetical protein